MAKQLPTAVRLREDTKLSLWDSYNKEYPGMEEAQTRVCGDCEDVDQKDMRFSLSDERTFLPPNKTIIHSTVIRR